MQEVRAEQFVEAGKKPEGDETDTPHKPRTGARQAPPEQEGQRKELGLHPGLIGRHAIGEDERDDHRPRSRCYECEQAGGDQYRPQGHLREIGDGQDDRIVARTPHRPCDPDRDGNGGHDDGAELGKIRDGTNQSRSGFLFLELKGYVVRGLSTSIDHLCSVCSELRQAIFPRTVTGRIRHARSSQACVV